MADNRGNKRPRIGGKRSHKDEFMQDRYFGFHHHEGDDRDDTTPRRNERKFGNKHNDEPRGERKFGKSKFNGNKREDGKSRRFGNDDMSERRERRQEGAWKRGNRFDDRDDNRRSDNDKPFGRRYDNDNERGFGRDRNKPFGKRFDNSDDGDNRDRRRQFDDRDRQKTTRRRFNDEMHDGDSRERRSDSRRFDDRNRDKRSKDRNFDDRKPRKGRSYDSRDRQRHFDSDEEAPRRGRKGYQREKDPIYDRPKATGEIRLNKYLSDSGICSRREADELIKAGTVTVNGEVITTMGFKVKPEDKVVYGGQTLNREKLRYLILNKPKGFITTCDDPYERDTVMDLISGACSEKVLPVGRLDRATTGLLLFTNDGDLIRHLTHPSCGVMKLYHATLDKPLTKNDMLRIAEGIELDDGFIAADSISYVEGDDTKKEIGIELHSGRNRIVRRIFEHLGYEVTKLDRTMFAGLDKYKLPRGEWRFLSDSEVTELKKI